MNDQSHTRNLKDWRDRAQTLFLSAAGDRSRAESAAFFKKARKVVLDNGSSFSRLFIPLSDPDLLSIYREAPAFIAAQQESKSLLVSETAAIASSIEALSAQEERLTKEHNELRAAEHALETELFGYLGIEPPPLVLKTLASRRALAAATIEPLGEEDERSFRPGKASPAFARTVTLFKQVDHKEEPAAAKAFEALLAHLASQKLVLQDVFYPREDDAVDSQAKLERKTNNLLNQLEILNRETAALTKEMRALAERERELLSSVEDLKPAVAALVRQKTFLERKLGAERLKRGIASPVPVPPSPPPPSRPKPAPPPKPIPQPRPAPPSMLWQGGINYETAQHIVDNALENSADLVIAALVPDGDKALLYVAAQTHELRAWVKKLEGGTLRPEDRKSLRAYLKGERSLALVSVADVSGLYVIPPRITFGNALHDSRELIDGLNAKASKRAQFLLNQSELSRLALYGSKVRRVVNVKAAKLAQRLPSRDQLSGLVEGILDGLAQRLPSRRTRRYIAALGIVGASTVGLVSVVPWSAWYKKAAESLTQSASWTPQTFPRPPPKDTSARMGEAIRYAKRSFNLQTEPRVGATSSAIRVDEGMGVLTGPGTAVDERGNVWIEAREFGSRKVLGYAEAASLSAVRLPEPVLEQAKQQVLYARESIRIAGQDGEAARSTNFEPGDAVLVRRISTAQGTSYAQVILPTDHSAVAPIDLQKLTAFPLLGRQADSLGRVWMMTRGEAPAYQSPRGNAQLVSRIAGGTPLLIGEHYLDAIGERWASAIDPRTGRYSGFLRARDLETLPAERTPPAAPAGKPKRIRFQQNTP
ncbi:hypothetical protein [Bradyrhizobium acaciae]|uniref:hypothetical protein n=1 Tax=Bradyrhizobium acaciae TaxID=2683706 RepID=UPI001E328083|nr:hypothetical protein [Bradyrhizobium acaciae]MCC8978896.1 hypothetical protein [Bradyrhizobium acaciae]